MKRAWIIAGALAVVSAAAFAQTPKPAPVDPVPATLGQSTVTSSCATAWSGSLFAMTAAPQSGCALTARCGAASGVSYAGSSPAMATPISPRPSEVFCERCAEFGECCPCCMCAGGTVQQCINYCGGC